MAKTSTERSRALRKRLKENAELHNVYKSKDRERKRAERSKSQVKSAGEIARQKKLNRERVRKCRILKKEKARTVVDPKEQEEANIYSTPQALGKAVGKVKPHLPKSPRKGKAVIVKLASSNGIELPRKKKKQFNNGNLHLSPEVTKKVQSFYLLDSISRQSPGKKDFVVSWQNGKKEHLQKRHLLFSLKEVHALFIKENPAVKIGLSKFSSLRPVNVLLSSDMPRNVCLCQYHENIKLICDCLGKMIPEFPSYSKTVIFDWLEIRSREFFKI